MVFGQNLPTPQKIGIERWMIRPSRLNRRLTVCSDFDILGKIAKHVDG